MSLQSKEESLGMSMNVCTNLTPRRPVRVPARNMGFDVKCPHVHDAHWILPAYADTRY